MGGPSTLSGELWHVYCSIKHKSHCCHTWWWNTVNSKYLTLLASAGLLVVTLAALFLPFYKVWPTRLSHRVGTSSKQANNQMYKCCTAAKVLHQYLLNVPSLARTVCFCRCFCVPGAELSCSHCCSSSWALAMPPTLLSLCPLCISSVLLTNNGCLLTSQQPLIQFGTSSQCPNPSVYTSNKYLTVGPWSHLPAVSYLIHLTLFFWPLWVPLELC